MKQWQPVIKQHIRTWSIRLGNLGWWPSYVYHFTDIQNAVSILKSGFLYSRIEATRLGMMLVDNASPDVIQQTSTDHLRYVRLYFRPRTPTQFRNEGIRPLNQRVLGGAHCPIPIYFCFDSLNVLSRDDCEFSDGNMGSLRAHHSGNEDFFSNIPFQLVYQNGAIYSEGEKDEIIFRRNAEVLVPSKLPIDTDLKIIVCRSSAEMQTLLHLLPSDVRRRWSPKIRLGERFYDRRWTFVEEVVTVDGHVIFRFNPNTITPGPFHVKFTYQEDGKTDLRIWEGTREKLDSSFELTIKNAFSGVATLILDDALAFSGRIILNNIPF